MNYFFITGDSSGIGKSLKSIVLEESSNFVFGISRRERSKSENFQPIQLDLSKSGALEGFEFPQLQDAETIVLVNNAGMLGPVKPIFEQNTEEIQAVYNLNAVVPAQLISKFIQSYENQKLIIINISSGAANNPIQAWSTYCSSKAGLDMLSRTLIEDLKFRQMNNVQVYSVSPGVIDTPMQGEIRASEKKNFALHSKFSDLKTNEELVDPTVTAKLIYRIFTDPDSYDQSFINLRDFY